jgi:hypothetical protein
MQKIFENIEISQKVALLLQRSEASETIYY